MPLKRPWEDVTDEYEYNSLKRGPLGCNDDTGALASSSFSPPDRLTEKDAEHSHNIDATDSQKWQSGLTPTRQQPIARSTRERFVPGLQTLVGGLQMSQRASSSLTATTSSQNQSSSRLDGLLGPSDAIQPLVMSRSSDAEQRSVAGSEPNDIEAHLSPQASTLPTNEEPQAPGVSPGWHVEAHGRQAMELQDGVRHEDEDGWTPLDVFPAATPQGRSVAHRARLRALNRLSATQQDSSTSCVSGLDLQSEPALLAEKTAPFIVVTSLDTVSASEEAVLPETERESVPYVYRADTSKAQKYCLQDFDLLETLGTGTFGRVLLVRLKGREVNDRTAYFALKILAKSDIVRLKQVSHVTNEKDILTKVDHPFLVNMIDTFQDRQNCYMLLEYVVGGEVFSYLRRAGSFSADVARFYVATIVLAIEYLHNNNIIYRDLKPENLLIDSSGYTKVTDFGFAKQVEERTWTLCGTPEYLAPEIIQCSGHGKAVDWWSLGVLLFEMLAGYPPFCDPNPLNVYEKILQGHIIFPDHIDFISRHLISSLLTADRSKRLGNLRNGAQDVKNHAWFLGVNWQDLEQKKIRPPIIPYLGKAGDTSNFSKYDSVQQSELPSRPGKEPADLTKLDDHFSNLFLDF